MKEKTITKLGLIAIVAMAVAIVLVVAIGPLPVVPTVGNKILVGLMAVSMTIGLFSASVGCPAYLLRRGRPGVIAVIPTLLVIGYIWLMAFCGWVWPLFR